MGRHDRAIGALPFGILELGHMSFAVFPTFLLVTSPPAPGEDGEPHAPPSARISEGTHARTTVRELDIVRAI